MGFYFMRRNCIMDTLALLATALICLPFVMAILPAVIKVSKIRSTIVYICGAIVAVLAVITAGMWFMNGGTAITFDLPYTGVFDKIILIGDFLLMFLIIYLSIRHHKTDR